MTAGRRNTATHQKMSEPPWIVAGTRDPKESIMCWACDHPGATRADHLDHVRTVIAQYGWAVQDVRRDGIHPPWTYTVGLTTFGRSWTPRKRNFRGKLTTVGALPASVSCRRTSEISL